MQFQNYIIMSLLINNCYITNTETQSDYWNLREEERVFPSTPWRVPNFKGSAIFYLFKNLCIWIEMWLGTWTVVLWQPVPTTRKSESLGSCPRPVLPCLGGIKFHHSMRALNPLPYTLKASSPQKMCDCMLMLIIWIFMKYCVPPRQGTVFQDTTYIKITLINLAY